MNEATPSKNLLVAVTGATGQQGGALARLLLARGHRVRALTRHPDGAAAQALAEAGATAHRVDLDTGEGVDAAVTGVDAAFLVTTPFERGAAAEPVQAEHFGRAAARAGVRHVVYSSVTAAMTRSPVEHFAAKGRAERSLTAMDLPLTIIGAPPFLDNVVAPWHLPWLRRGIFALPVADTTPMPMVLTRDIAAVAGHVLEQRDTFVGERLDIATEAITGSTIKKVIEAASGRTFRAETKSFAELDPMLGKLFAGIGGGPEDRGARPAASRAGRPAPVDLQAVRARLPGVLWSSFRTWADSQDWAALLGA